MDELIKQLLKPETMNTLLPLIGTLLVFFFMRNSDKANPIVEVLIKVIRTVFKVPDTAAESSDHAHDLTTIDGTVCATKCLAERLEKLGKKPLADKLRGALVDVVTTMSKEAAE